MINNLASSLAIISFLIYLYKSIKHSFFIRNPLKEIYLNTNIGTLKEFEVVDCLLAGEGIEIKMNSTFKCEGVKALNISICADRGPYKKESINFVDPYKPLLVRIDNQTMIPVLIKDDSKGINTPYILDKKIIHIGRFIRFLEFINLMISKFNKRFNTSVLKSLENLYSNYINNRKLFNKYNRQSESVAAIKLYVKYLVEGIESEYYIYIVISENVFVDG